MVFYIELLVRFCQWIWYRHWWRSMQWFCGVVYRDVGAGNDINVGKEVVSGDSEEVNLNLEMKFFLSMEAVSIEVSKIVLV